MKKRKYLDKERLPTRSGVYLINDPLSPGSKKEIEVYRHPAKSLCCFTGDYGAEEGAGVSDAHDCHVSVQLTGIKFIKYLRSLTQKSPPKR